MDHFPTKGIGRTFVMRLDQGDYVLESIISLIQKEAIRDAVIVSAIGTLDRCKLHMVMTTGYPPMQHIESLDNRALELSSIDGVIANGVPHLHAVVSDSEKAYAGHLEEGCRVLYLAEIVVTELASLALDRTRDDKGILKLYSRRDAVPEPQRAHGPTADAADVNA
jgi:predicted DNA-binding protein with PD1-like motif